MEPYLGRPETYPDPAEDLLAPPRSSGIGMRFITDRTRCVTQSPPPLIDPLNDPNTNPCVEHGPELGPDLIDDPIVAGLRTLYREVLAEPVPDEFTDLLAQIDAALAAIPVDPAAAPNVETEKEPGS
ncbi:MAG TPA: hypothetical protein DIU09_08465 [Hyphomonadaceae bacterium]|nr:hypothetical protein AEM38_01120 [Hyphomonadaceae bacterium UKL13-1]HCP64608.1 hypothetical protein [Hyphomonadaceae bacterium]